MNFRPKSLNFTIFYIIYALIDWQIMRYIEGDSSFSVLPNKEDSYWMWWDFKCRGDQEKLRKLRKNSWSENVFVLCEKCWMISKAIIVLVICQWRSHSSERIMGGQGNPRGKRYTNYPLSMVMTFTLLFRRRALLSLKYKYRIRNKSKMTCPSHIALFSRSAK